MLRYTLIALLNQLIFEPLMPLLFEQSCLQSLEFPHLLPQQAIGTLLQLLVPFFLLLPSPFISKLSFSL
jgi:hypothetical protein